MTRDSLQLQIRARGEYDLAAESFLLLMVEPPLQGGHFRVLDERLDTTPTVEAELGRDAFGNPLRRILARAGVFSFEFRALVETTGGQPLREDAQEFAPSNLPAEILPYLLPSRYCQSDLLARMARDEFGALPPGGSRVRQIADWVRRHVEYRYGQTDAMTSAYDTATQRIGVCRDFAHLVIAFCRALNIPARYVSGYALGLEPQDFHGYVQVYLGEEWQDVDATCADRRPALIPIAVGRDAADVAMVTFFGPATLQGLSVEVSGSRGSAPPHGR